MIQLLRGGKWDVMRCQLLSVRCCYLHLSRNASSPGLCVLHLPSAHLYSPHLLSAEVPEWSQFPVLISLRPSLFVLYFQRWAFWLPCLLPHSSGGYRTTREETEKLSLSKCDFHLIQIFFPPHLPFFFYRFSRPRRLSFSHHGPRGRMARGEAWH